MNIYGNLTEYNGTYYHKETDPKLVELLEKIRKDQTRCKFHLGNVETGEDREEQHNITGRIGRSTGPIKIPLLIYNSRSISGGALMDQCIVKITTTKGNFILYKHENYHKIT